MPGPLRAAVLTISDSVAKGEREDRSGPAVRQRLEARGWSIQITDVLPDEFTLIRERLFALASSPDLDAVFTTGGTGLGPRDRTPEATTSVMERSVPGLVDLMRREGLKTTPLASLSRAVAGVKGKTLLINLPGSPSGAAELLEAILEVLPHAIAVIRGEAAHEPAAAALAAPPAEPAPVAAAPEAAPVVAAGEEGLGKPESV